MTNPVLTLEGVSYVLPDGRTLFSNLYETFDHRRTGLVGRNGVGKSLLARMLAGQLSPDSGRCLCSGSVHYLAQQVAHPENATVASLANVHQPLAALARIETGSIAVEDFEAVGERWDLRQRLQEALVQYGLGHLDMDMPARSLSGGEAMCVALAGAWLSDADFLILDEPSNHLDRAQRHVLIDALQRWPRGLLVVSHDRQLLEGMERIVELSLQGLRGYGGSYGFYAAAKALEHQQALRQLEHSKLERQREAQAMREQRERMARRQARGKRQGKESNQASIVLDRQKERSEGAAGKLRQQQAAAKEVLDRSVRQAASKVPDEACIALRSLPLASVHQRRVVELDTVLPFVQGALSHVVLDLNGQQRVGVIGGNGCGKSTLLKVLAGQVVPLAGTCQVIPDAVYLDQGLANLAPEQSVLVQLQTANPRATESDLRTRLAQLGLEAQKITVPSGALSGGERLKVALACALYADPPARLLLLDEPGNHLDLPSIQALEVMLRSYQGAMIVVSHDDSFLENLALTHRLLATESGWCLELW